MVQTKEKKKDRSTRAEVRSCRVKQSPALLKRDGGCLIADMGECPRVCCMKKLNYGKCFKRNYYHCKSHYNKQEYEFPWKFSFFLYGRGLIIILFNGLTGRCGIIPFCFSRFFGCKLFCFHCNLLLNLCLTDKESAGAFRLVKMPELLNACRVQGNNSARSNAMHAAAKMHFSRFNGQFWMNSSLYMNSSCYRYVKFRIKEGRAL